MVMTSQDSIEDNCNIEEPLLLRALIFKAIQKKF